MRISEIFSSIQGEGKYTGYPTTFIRVFGCPFKCDYCDTEYAKNGASKRMSLDRIISKVSRLGNQHICITGGEPLLDDDTFPLIYELLSYSYIVSVETSGLVSIEECPYKRSYSFTMDIKCPCSGVENLNKYGNLANLRANDEVKFVVRDEKDLDFVVNVLKKYPTKAEIILSPLDNDEDTCKLILQYLAEKKIKGKIGVQLHKLLDVK